MEAVPLELTLGPEVVVATERVRIQSYESDRSSPGPYVGLTLGAGWRPARLAVETRVSVVCGVGAEGCIYLHAGVGPGVVIVRSGRFALEAYLGPELGTVAWSPENVDPIAPFPARSYRSIEVGALARVEARWGLSPTLAASAFVAGFYGVTHTREAIYAATQPEIAFLSFGAAVTWNPFKVSE